MIRYVFISILIALNGALVSVPCRMFIILIYRSIFQTIISGSPTYLLLQFFNLKGRCAFYRQLLFNLRRTFKLKFLHFVALMSRLSFELF